MRDIYIHLGLHKTATTLLQKHFFPLYNGDIYYLDLQRELRPFLLYILRTHDLEFDTKVAQSLFLQHIPEAARTRNTYIISEEELCGSPWNNAADRIRSFDRLNMIYPAAKYIIFLRNQEDITDSLYLQYIKAGGTLNWTKFLIHNQHPLSFAGKTYLNYQAYLKYMVRKTDRSRVICMLYEDLVKSPVECLQLLEQRIGYRLNAQFEDIVKHRENKSVTNVLVPIFLFFNKIFSSRLNPGLLLPARIRWHIIKVAIQLFSGKKKKHYIPDHALKEFCQSPKTGNFYINELTERDIESLGY